MDVIYKDDEAQLALSGSYQAELNKNLKADCLTFVRQRDEAREKCEGLERAVEKAAQLIQSYRKTIAHEAPWQVVDYLQEYDEAYAATLGREKS